jgi:hypothetical protein
MEYDEPTPEVLELAEKTDWLSTSPKLLDILQNPEIDLGRCELISMTSIGKFYRSRKTGYLFFVEA